MSEQVAASGGVDELAGLAHRAFHEAWTLPEPLNLYADSPIWQRIAEVIAREWLPEREAKAWDEGYRARANDGMRWGKTHVLTRVSTPNPYRERADREEQGR